MKTSCYLHKNGDLIFKHYDYEYEGDLVVKYWRYEDFTPIEAADLLNELKSLPINNSRLENLQAMWNPYIEAMENGAK